MTTSRDVAHVFGKRHDNILRDIENLECSANFGALNFELTYYKVRNGLINKQGTSTATQ